MVLSANVILHMTRRSDFPDIPYLTSLALAHANTGTRFSPCIRRVGPSSDIMKRPPCDWFGSPWADSTAP